MKSKIELFLDAELGHGARYRFYNESLKTPLNYFINTGVRASNIDDFKVVWVDRGLPELFSITKFSPRLVVFNTRFIELVYRVYSLIYPKFDIDHASRSELIESVCLSIISELAICHGDPNLAVQAFLKSAVDQNITMLSEPGVDLMALEHEPLDERYAVIWFLGLLHEFGHLQSEDRFRQGKGSYPAEKLNQMRQDIARQYPYPDDEIRAALLDASSPGSMHVLSDARLGPEILSDIFAAQMLLQVTPAMMQKVGKQFNPALFLHAHASMTTVQYALERCRAVALTASMHKQDEALRRMHLLWLPVSYSIRTLAVREYLTFATASWLSDEPSEETLGKVSTLMDQIHDDVSKTGTLLETALARAMRFALFPDRRPNDLMRRFAINLEKRDVSSVLAVSEAKRLCELADTFRISSESITALRTLVN